MWLFVSVISGMECFVWHAYQLSVRVTAGFLTVLHPHRSAGRWSRWHPLHLVTCDSNSLLSFLDQQRHVCKQTRKLMCSLSHWCRYQNVFWRQGPPAEMRCLWALTILPTLLERTLFLRKHVLCSFFFFLRISFLIAVTCLCPFSLALSYPRPFVNPCEQKCRHFWEENGATEECHIAVGIIGHCMK